MIMIMTTTPKTTNFDQNTVENNSIVSKPGILFQLYSTRYISGI